MNQPEGYVLVQIKQLAQWREWANNVAAWSKQADRSSEVARLKASISSAMISATLPPASAAGEQAEAPSDWEGLPLDEVHPEWRDALLDYQAQLQQANRRFVDVSVALMKYVPASEAAAKSALQKLGDAHGYGWCQTALGQMWDEKHGCAPRGSMGVTVKDAAKQAVPDGYQLVMVPKLAPDDEPDWDECIRQSEDATGIKVERCTLSIVIREVRRWLAHRAALATKPQAEQPATPPAQMVQDSAPKCDVCGWRRCNFCGCNTNASLRACCDAGKQADTARTRGDGVGKKP